VVQQSLGPYIHSEYSQLVVPLTASGHSSNSLTITFVSMDANSRLSLDDVALVRTDTVVPVFPMVCDGGFEAGTFACWDDGGYTDLTFVSSDDVFGILPHSGSFFAALGSQEKYNTLLQPVWVSSASTYLVSCWLAIGPESSVSNSFYAYVSYNSQFFLFDEVYDAQASGYAQQFAVVSTPGVSGTQQLQLTFYSSDGPSYLGLDDVAVVPATNLIKNGGFEKGDFTSWQLSGSKSGVLVSSGSNAYSGLYFAALGASGATNTLTQSVAVAAGAQYSLQFWLSGDTGDTPSSLLVTTKFKTHATVQHFSLTNLPAGYQLFSVTLPAFPSAGQLKLSFVSEDTPSYLWLDAVSLVRLE
jgi:hypothetical protein